MDRPAESLDKRILILAPARRDGPSVAELIVQEGLLAEVCPDLPALCEALAAGAGAVLVSEEALATEEQHKAFLAALAQQPHWSELPVLLVSGRHQRSRLLTSEPGGYPNVVLLERPMRAATLVSALQSALRARRRQYDIRNYLREQARQRAELRRLNTTLEQRVAERTRELEEAMRRSQEAEKALRQSQKMEAIGQLTGGIAHDFNNLLMVITAGLDLMERTDDAARQERLRREMRQATEKGRVLIGQLLAFARKTTLAPEVIELRELLDGMQILLRGALGSKVAVQIDVAEDLWPIFADPTQLELALLNLAVNARDAMPSGGRLSIGARNKRMEEAESGGLSGDFVQITVADTGSGIPPEILERVFEPFFTTKPVGKGTGLGLSQVYGFAKQSGGLADLRTELGVGTEIILHLPRASTTKQPTASGEVPQDQTNDFQLGRSALLVEDSDQVAALTTEMLQNLGFAVERARDAREALDKLESGYHAELVLSDILMPGDMNGMGFARELKRKRPQLPVLLMTGYSESAAELLPSDNLSLLKKPFDLAELEAALRDCCRKYESTPINDTQAAE